MKTIQRLLVGTISICTVLSLLTACGSESDSAVPERVDGPIVELTTQDDSYHSGKGDNNSLQNITSTAENQFTAARATAIQIQSADSTPCHVNIYSDFTKLSTETYIPDPTARVMQINSATCDYSGMLYVMHHWESLLVEVIIIEQNSSTRYFEATLPSDAVVLNVN